MNYRSSHFLQPTALVADMSGYQTPTRHSRAAHVDAQAHGRAAYEANMSAQFITALLEVAHAHLDAGVDTIWPLPLLTQPKLTFLHELVILKYRIHVTSI